MYAIIVLAVVVGLVIGFSRGGSLRNVANLRVRGTWLVLIALGVHLALSRPAWQSALGLSAFGDLLYPAADAVLVVFTLLNIRGLPWSSVLALGLGSNVLVKVLNGGKMPVAPDLAALLGVVAENQDLGAKGIWLHTTYIDAHTRLPFLGDVIYLGPPYPWPRLCSVGDLLLALGVVLVVQGAMTVRPRATGSTVATRPSPPQED